MSEELEVLPQDVEEEFVESTDIKTAYEYQVAILAELWMGYRDDAEFVEFIEYNDLGLLLHTQSIMRL